MNKMQFALEFEALTREYRNWAIASNYFNPNEPEMNLPSADELLSELLTSGNDEHACDWLRDFIMRWEELMDVEP